MGRPGLWGGTGNNKQRSRASGTEKVLVGGEAGQVGEERCSRCCSRVSGEGKGQ